MTRAAKNSCSSIIDRRTIVTTFSLPRSRRISFASAGVLGLVLSVGAISVPVHAADSGGYPRILFENPPATAVAGSTVNFTAQARDTDGTYLATLTSGFSIQSHWNDATPDDVHGSMITFANPGLRRLDMTLDADPSVSTQYSLMVLAGPMKAIAIQPPSSIAKGSPATFAVTGLDANNYETPTPSVIFSTVPDTSTIVGNVITFNEAAPYQVIATTADDLSKSVYVTAGKGTLTGITATTNASSVVFGQSVTASASGLPAAGTVSYRWYRGGSPIAGATDATYTPVATDVNAVVQVAAAVVSPGYFDFVSAFSAPVTVEPATIGSTSVTISGAAQFGKVLSAVTTGTAGASVSINWYRSGSAAAIGSGSILTLAAADVASTITAKASISKPGFASVTTSSKAIVIAKDSAKLSTKLPSSFKKKKKTTITVTLARGASALPATGSVRVYYGSKYVTVKYTATTKATVKVVLPKLKKGTYKVSVKYLGSPTYAAVSTPVKSITSK